MKSTKKSLLLSTISLVLCFAMLLGTTWAWFTDEVTSGTNKIVAGNLDIEVSYKDGENWVSIEGKDSLFNKNALWEPGHTEYVNLKIENKGTLALKYQMNVSPISEIGGINMAGDPFKLSDYLVFATADATEAGYADRDAARTAAGDTMKLNQAGLSKKVTMLAGADPQYITLVVYMPEEVGNVANYKTGTTAPQIELGITVLATQLQNESDSFGIDYDKDAAYDPDKNTIVYNYFPQVAQSATLKKSGNTVTATGAEVNGGEVTIKSAVKVKEVTGVDADANKEFASVQLPADTVADLLTDENDHVIALNVNKDDTANASFKAQAGAPDLTDKETTTYEVNVTKDGEKVPETENLYTVKMFIGENKQNLVMYHNNAKMTQKDTPAANNEYNYNPNDGYVTMCVNSFSPFTSVYDEPVAAIGTKVYYSLESAITAAQANDTVVLLKNVAVKARINIDKTMALDLNGKTISADAGFTPKNSGVIGVKRGGDLTVNDGAGNGKIQSGENVYAAVAMTVKDESENGAVAKLTVNGGTLEGYYYGIVNNGSRHDTEIIVNGGTIIGSNTADSSGIYHPNKGTLTVNGGTIKGGNGISVKGGTPAITVNGGNIIGMANNFNPTAAATSGVNTVGSAIYVEGNYGYDATINLEGGTFTTTDPNATAVRMLFNEESKASISITGGTFSSDPKAYVAANHNVINNGNGTWTVSFGVAQIVETGVKYGSLVDAITEAGNDGKTIKMLCDTEYTDVGFKLKNVNLDLGGYTIKVTRTDSSKPRNFDVFGDVTISNGKIDARLGTKFNGAIYVNKSSTATLNNVDVKARYTDDSVAYGAAVFGEYLDNPNGGMVINGGVFDSMITSNGSTRGGSLTINDGTFMQDLYLPAHMDYTITGGTFKKKVEFRSGVISISGGNFQNSGTPACPNPNLQDPIIDGCSVGLVAHNGPIDNSHDSGYGPAPKLNITGGTFAGQIGLYKMDAEYEYPAVTIAEDVNVTTAELGVK